MRSLLCVWFCTCAALIVLSAEAQEQEAKPLTLDEVVESALETHPDLQSATLSRQEAERRVEGSDHILPWQLTAQANYTHQDQPVRDNFSQGLQIRDTLTWSVRALKRWTFGLDLQITFDNVTARTETPISYNLPNGVVVKERNVVGPLQTSVLGATLTYHILAGGDAYINRLPQAQAQAQLTISELDAQRRTSELLLQITQAYLDLWLRDAELSVRRATLTALDQQQEVTAALVEGGILAEVELDLLLGQRLNAEEAILLAEAARDQAALQLEIVSGAPVMGRPVAVPSADLPPVDTLPKTPPTDLCERAYAVRLSQARAETQRLEIARTEAALDPTLDVQVILQQQGLDENSDDSDWLWGAYGQTFGLHAGTAGVGVIFSMPLDRGLLRSEAEAAHIAADRLSRDASTTCRQIQQQFTTSLRLIQAQHTRLKLLSESEAAAAHNLSQAQDRYQAKLITTLDIQRLRDELESTRLKTLTAQTELLRQWAITQHLSTLLLDDLGVSP